VKISWNSVDADPAKSISLLCRIASSNPCAPNVEFSVLGIYRNIEITITIIIS
jgi:hypothetical protein